MSTQRALYGIGLVLCVAGATACSSESGGGGGGNDNKTGDAAVARQFFLDKVYPSVEPTCAKCHASGERGAPIFMASGGPATYTDCTPVRRLRATRGTSSPNG
jgi:hypothetical protein